MNRYHADIQDAIGRLGERIAQLQLLAGHLAGCRGLEDARLDPESELALVCWLEEAADLTGYPRPARRERRRT